MHARRMYISRSTQTSQAIHARFVGAAWNGWATQETLYGSRGEPVWRDEKSKANYVEGRADPSARRTSWVGCSWGSIIISMVECEEECCRPSKCRVFVCRQGLQAGDSRCKKLDLVSDVAFCPAILSRLKWEITPKKLWKYECVNFARRNGGCDCGTCKVQVETLSGFQGVRACQNLWKADWTTYLAQNPNGYYPSKPKQCRNGYQHKACM